MMAPRQGSQPPAATAETFGAALRQHQSGRLQDAEALYRKILSRDPSHVGSLHYLGVLAHQTGRSEQATELIGRAIALNPAIPDCHYTSICARPCSPHSPKRGGARPTSSASAPRC